VNPHDELADIAAQVADHHRAERDEARDAERYDRTDYIKVGGEWYEARRVPDPADVWDL
jgi:hypothetical protein